VGYDPFFAWHEQPASVTGLDYGNYLSAISWERRENLCNKENS
jgi:hypothetical protein